MNKLEIMERLDQPLNWGEVEKAFIEYWTKSFLLGEVTFFQLSDRGYLGETHAECFALVLVGVARVLSKNIGNCPGDVYQYYEAACKVLEGTPFYKDGRDLVIEIKVPTTH